MAAMMAAVVPLAPAAAHDVAVAGAERAPRSPYRAMVQQVAAMPGDPGAQALVGKQGLSIVNVMWEDTGRYLGSTVGPNISDVTIEVAMGVGKQQRTALMPVIRYPNFEDLTGDVRLDKLRIPVGNQAPGWKAGDPLQTITLRDLLAEPARYLTLPERGKIKGGSLLAKRDSHALVSAQATFLPVPSEGEATFWPVIFNYQSTRKNPAVLTLLVTRQGTSATIVDNARDSLGAQEWGQRLFFNAGGQRTPLTAERLSAVEAHGTTSNGEAASSLGADANLLMLVQIPLKHREVRHEMVMELGEAPGSSAAGGVKMKAAPSAASPAEHARGGAHIDVEAAVLGHGPELGPYTELDGLTIERDPRFPVRVTVQFYQATSNGRLSAAVVHALNAQIRRVYKQANYVGSLVVPADERATAGRPTAWTGTAAPPQGLSVDDFPGLVERMKRYGLAPWDTQTRIVHPPMR